MRRGAAVLRCHARLRQQTDTHLVADVTIVDADDRLVMAMTDFVARAVANVGGAQGRAPSPASDHVFRVVWEPRPAEPLLEPEPEVLRRWLLVASDDVPLAALLAPRLPGEVLVAAEPPQNAVEEGKFRQCGASSFL